MESTENINYRKSGTRTVASRTNRYSRMWVRRLSRIPLWIRLTWISWVSVILCRVGRRLQRVTSSGLARIRRYTCISIWRRIRARITLLLRIRRRGWSWVRRCRSWRIARLRRVTSNGLRRITTTRLRWVTGLSLVSWLCRRITRWESWLAGIWRRHCNSRLRGWRINRILTGRWRLHKVTNRMMNGLTTVKLWFLYGNWRVFFAMNIQIKRYKIYE